VNATRAALRKMGRIAIALATSLSLAAGTACGARALDNDRSRAVAYLRAVDAFTLGARRELVAVEHAYASVRHDVKQRCPQILHRAPHGHALAIVDEEIVAVLSALSYRARDAGILAFVRAVHHIHFQNVDLAREISAYIRQLQAERTLALPDLCVQFTSWRVSGYRRLPASVLRLRRQVQMIEGEEFAISGEQRHPLASGEDEIERMIVRLLPASERGLARRSAAIRNAVGDREIRLLLTNAAAIQNALEK
jgi:hypothetical protein